MLDRLEEVFDEELARRRTTLSGPTRDLCLSVCRAVVAACERDTPYEPVKIQPLPREHHPSYCDCAECRAARGF